MAQRYICSLPNPGTNGPVHELFYSDDETGRARAEAFAQRENRAGRGVYDCIGKLKAGAKSRCKENVDELEQVVSDLDLKNIGEPRDKVIEVLRGLPLQPSEIRDSGFGLHAVWRLKEAVTDNAGLEQAEHVVARLAELLAGDKAPTHRAALLRHPGSDNTKDGSPRKCHAIEQSDRQCDVSEFEDMFDLYGDRPLLTRQPKANGRDHSAEDREAVDIDAEFASIHDGAGANDAQCRIIPSLLRRGDHPNDVLELVADRTVERTAHPGRCSRRSSPCAGASCPPTIICC